MKKIATAVAVTLALSAGAASAQSDTATMNVGLSMLELAVSKQLIQLGITTDPMALSLNQLAQIKGVLGSSDYSVNEQKRQIETIVLKN